MTRRYRAFLNGICAGRAASRPSLVAAAFLAAAPTHANSAVAKPPAATPAVVGSTETTQLPLLPAPTTPITVPLAIARLDAFDRGLKSLTADFRQFVRWDETGSTQQVEGHVDYQKPDRLRIQQRLPEPQLVVGDGNWLWVYRESTNQVIQTRLEDWKRSEPLAQGLLDFGAYGDMLRRYDVSLDSVTAAPAAEGGAEGHKLFSLVLRPRHAAASSDFTLRLRLSTRDFFPRDTELRVGSVVVHSLFSNIQYNPPVPDDRFRFRPPAGADVFKNLKPPQP